MEDNQHLWTSKDNSTLCGEKNVSSYTHFLTDYPIEMLCLECVKPLLQKEKISQLFRELDELIKLSFDGLDISQYEIQTEFRKLIGKIEKHLT